MKIIFLTLVMGIEIGVKNNKYLKLFDNGHMEFWTPLDEGFCWRQSDEEFKKRPRLYPYAVIEYPVTFLRLYQSIIKKLNISKEFEIIIYYNNLKGYALLPFAPGIIGFESPININVYEKKDFTFKTDIPNNFLPDIEAYNLIKRFYKSFNLGPETIPFYNDQEEKFEFHT